MYASSVFFEHIASHFFATKITLNTFVPIFTLAAGHRLRPNRWSFFVVCLCVPLFSLVGSISEQDDAAGSALTSIFWLHSIFSLKFSQELFLLLFNDTNAKLSNWLLHQRRFILFNLMAGRFNWVQVNLFFLHNQLLFLGCDSSKLASHCWTRLTEVKLASWTVPWWLNIFALQFGRT